MTPTDLDAPLNLIPWPRSLGRHSGCADARAGATVVLRTGRPAHEDASAIDRLRSVCRSHWGFEPAVRDEGQTGASRGLDIVFEGLPADERPDRYVLIVEPDRIRLAGGDARSRRCGVQTLRQLIAQFGPRLPALEIEDWADFAERGLLLDVSRGKVPTMASLFALVERLADLKYNRLQLYVEHVFAFERHPELGAGHDPLTPDEIRALDAHARAHGIELVPNLQTLGHAAHILEHPRYRALAESDFRGGWTLAPAEPAVYRLLEDMLAEYLPCFSSTAVHLNGDEPWDLGRGRSAALARELGGVGPLYAYHLRRLAALPSLRGRRLMIWGDVVLHYPDAAPLVPPAYEVMYWHYDAHGREREYGPALRKLHDANVRAGVAPGTGAWLSAFFRRDNARANIRAMAQAGRGAQATQFLLTDWGDEGHLNFISQSYWSIAYGAECAWTADSPDADAERRFDERFLATQLPGAPSSWLTALELLGATYRAFERSCGLPNHAIRAMLTGEIIPGSAGTPQLRFLYGHRWPCPTLDEIRAMEAMLDRAEPLLAPCSALPDETERVRREWLTGIEWARIACGRVCNALGDAASPGAWRAALAGWLDRMEALWMERNRPSDWASIRRALETLARGEREAP